MHVTLSRVPDGPVEYQVPMPADCRYTFTGSGLPFASEAMAFRPAQCGAATALGTTLRLAVDHVPNAYHGPGGELVRPAARVRYTCGGAAVSETLTISGVPFVVPHRNLLDSEPQEQVFDRSAAVSQEAQIRAKGFALRRP